MQEIRFERSRTISGAELASVFARSGINRPTGDPQRMQQMADTANLLMTAWNGDCLVGVARSLTDFCAACYLASGGGQHLPEARHRCAIGARNPQRDW